MTAISNGVATTTSDVLVVENIHKSFGNVEILKELSLAAKGRDVVPILGSSG